MAAVPGRVTSSIARGTNGLLRDGAVPVTGTADVLDELFGVGMRTPVAFADRPSEPNEPLLRSVLAEVERCSSVEAIGDATGLAVAEVRAALGRLEVDGYLVRRDLGGWERERRGDRRARCAPRPWVSSASDWRPSTWRRAGWW